MNRPATTLNLLPEGTKNYQSTVIKASPDKKKELKEAKELLDRALLSAPKALCIAIQGFSIPSIIVVVNSLESIYIYIFTAENFFFFYIYTIYYISAPLAH